MIQEVEAEIRRIAERKGGEIRRIAKAEAGEEISTNSQAVLEQLHALLKDPRELGALFVQSIILEVCVAEVFEEPGKTEKMLEMIEIGLGIFAELRAHFLTPESVEAAIPDAATRWPLVFAVSGVESRAGSK